MASIRNQRVVGRIIRKVMASADPQGKPKIKETMVFPIYDKVSGSEIVQVHAIDAKECLASGIYTTEPPAGVEKVEVQEIAVAADSSDELPPLPQINEGFGSAVLLEPAQEVQKEEVLTRGAAPAKKAPAAKKKQA